MYNELITSISALASSFLAKKFELNHMESGFITTIVSFSVSTILNIEYSSIINIFKDTNYKLYIYYLIFPLLCILILYTIYKFKRNIKKILYYNKKKVLRVYEKEYFEDFNTYFIEIIKIKKKEINIGNLELISQKFFGNYYDDYYDNNSNTLPNINIEIPFEDKLYGTSGTITWLNHEEERQVTLKNSSSQTNKMFKIIYLEIIFNSDKDPIEYKKFITKEVEKYKENEIKLGYFKVLEQDNNNNNDDDIHHVLMYEGDMEDKNSLKKKFIDSFFHPKKDYIWKNVDAVINNKSLFDMMGQGSFINYILYGPPGSGKSSFAYRLARTLNCNIISIDLSSIKTKKELYRIVQSPDLWLHNKDYWDFSKKNIIVLEELDVALKKLEQNKQKLNVLDSRVKEYFNTIYSHNKVNIQDDEQQNTKKGKYEELVGELDDAGDDYTIRDLLDILQGSLSVEGSIIIAMTNKIDYIRDSCPELVRDGRLTPVYFGYLDVNSFQELCQYHFNKKASSKQIDQLFQKKNCIDIPTSTILKNVKNSKIMYDSDFNKFIELIISDKKKLNNG